MMARFLATMQGCNHEALGALRGEFRYRRRGALDRGRLVLGTLKAEAQGHASVASWLVTGQVLTSDPKDFVDVSVLKCEILETRYDRAAEEEAAHQAQACHAGQGQGGAAGRSGGSAAAPAEED